MSSSSRSDQQVNVVRCQECRSVSGLTWWGWRAYRCDDPETSEPPALAFYCPACAAREFDLRADD
jgi:Zn finger protein HypA/HybF involved in hydrogenase expression